MSATLDLIGARQAIKITRWRHETATGRASHQTVYAVTSLTSADATAQDLARLIREHWSVEAHHHIRDVTIREATFASRPDSGPKRTTEPCPSPQASACPARGRLAMLAT